MAEYGLKYRFADAFGRIRRPEKLATLFLLFILLTIATASVTNSLIGPNWGSLWKGLLLALLTGWLLAIFRQPAIRSLVIILILGVVYTLFSVGGLGQKAIPVLLEPFRLIVASVTSPGRPQIDISALLSLSQEFLISLGVILERVRAWVSALGAGEPTFDPVAAGIVWGLLVWIVAAWAGWIVEAGRNGLLAVIPLILLSVGTLSYGRRISSTIYVILGLTLLLLATVQHDRREVEWDSAGVSFPSRKGRQIGYIAILLTTGLVLVSAFISSISLQQVENWLTVRSRSAAPGEERLAKSLGIISVSTSVPDTFEAIRSPGLPRDLLIGSGPELSRKLVMTIEVNEFPSVIKASLPWPLYWRSFTYDVYTGNGWRSSNTDESIYAPNQSIETNKTPNHLLIQETVRSIGESDGNFYAAGEPVLINEQSSAAWRSNSDLFGVQIPKGDSYEAQSSIPLVEEETLRGAGQRYPDWVRQRYLALPQDIPGRINDLAIQLTSTEPTPYDRVRSIERYLRTFPYTVDVPRPPLNRDLVDYFLFDLKQGYCDYYASAMVVLARAAGVPARLVIGYASGEYNEKSQRFMVTEADAHSWAEVYFPNSGWIPFEPTASRPLLEEAPSSISESPLETAPPVTESKISIAKSNIWKWILLPGGGILAILLIIAWAAYDWFRLHNLTEPEAAMEVYRRMRLYGARLAVSLEAGDTPYEYATSLNQRLEELSSHGTSPGIGLFTTQQIQAIADRIVRVSYRPIRLEGEPKIDLESQWRKLRWRLSMMMILQGWTVIRGRFSKKGKENPATPVVAGGEHLSTENRRNS